MRTKTAAMSIISVVMHILVVLIVAIVIYAGAPGLCFRKIVLLG